MTEPTTAQNVKQKAKTISHNVSDRVAVVQAKTQMSGSYKDYDVAILKATSSRFYVVPKEKHVTTLLMATRSGHRMDIDYIMSGLLKRLHSATDWLTALKTLITFHRLIRENESFLIEQLLKVGEGMTKGRGGRILAVDNFLDTTNMEGRFDYSEWVRAYGKYLDEQLEVFSAIHWSMDQETGEKESRLKGLETKDLMFQLPFMQRLQRRLMDCVPRGAATDDHVVMYSLSLVLKESFKVYRAVSEGIINLADKFFNLEYFEAIKGLELYKEAVDSGEALTKYYSTLQQIPKVKQALDLPNLTPPPSEIVEAMEAYVSQKSRPGSAEGEASATPRRNVPLRKGRYLTQAALTGAPLPAHHTVSTTRDPGMILATGSGEDEIVELGELSPMAPPEQEENGDKEREEETTPEAAAAEGSEGKEEQQEGEDQPAVVEENETKKPVVEFDLLGLDYDDESVGSLQQQQQQPNEGFAAFDDDQQQQQREESTTEKTETVHHQPKKPSLSPLELLSELDLGGDANGSSSSPQQHQQGASLESVGSRVSSHGSFPLTPSPTPVGSYQYLGQLPQQQQQFAYNNNMAPSPLPSAGAVTSGVGGGSNPFADTSEGIQQQMYSSGGYMPSTQQQYVQQMQPQYGGGSITFQRQQQQGYPGGMHMMMPQQQPQYMSPYQQPQYMATSLQQQQSGGGNVAMLSSPQQQYNTMPSPNTASNQWTGVTPPAIAPPPVMGAPMGPYAHLLQPPVARQQAGGVQQAELFKTAGAHDPFGGLSGLPSGKK